MYEPREALKDFLYMRVVVLVLLIGVCGLIGSFAFREGVLYASVSMSPIRVVGEVTSYLETKYSVETVYTFIDQDGNVRSGERSFSRSDHDSPRLREQVEVLYASFDSELHSLEQDFHRNEIPFYMLSAAILISIFSVTMIIVSTFRIIQFTRESRYY